jgi:WD40 repeat protein/serine/threonine protein kinase/cell division protein FtsL
MNPPHSREGEIFKAARSLPSEQRAAYLKQTCGDDAQLRQRVEELLRTNQAGNLREGNLPENSGASGTIKISLPPDEKPGEKIGPYKIREKIGEGGCGVVYVADQEQPVRRRIALKVIKLGMDTHAVMARFEAERQALAMMDHPNIAKVLDAGATETGRPYFVMELVRGIKITDYCDQNKLSPRERLNLFVQICQAIQHAHQKGIIHRDIKPSNILVTLHDGVPVPKVIDFGIAKATEGRLTDLTIYTELHQFIGTPAYMSPEQAEMSGLDVDTRSDIYSLGVLLYELLTGRTPFDARELAESGLDAMRKTIREKEPLRPSTKLNTLKGEELTTTANRRGSDAPKLISLLRGDLDWIVMKCLEKDRTRRYETANGLAVDLKRHLNNEAVAARPPSAAYRFQKMVRRNKLAFVAVTAVAIALLLGIIVSAWQAVRATHAKEDALAAQAQEAVQRKNAEASESKAVAAQAGETKLREQAQADELAARQRAYASDMNAAMQELHGNNLGRALDLLSRQRPLAGQKDLRGWEWRYLWQQTHSDALFTLCQESAEINSLAASFDGNLLAIGNYHKGGVSVWDLQTRQEIAHLAESDTFIRSAFSPAESLLAFANFNVEQTKSTLHLWNAATRQMVAEIPLDGGCDGLAFSQDGKTLVTSLENINTSGGHIALWRIPDGTKLASYSSEPDAISPGTGFAATPDLSLAAYAYGSPQPQKVCVIDLRDGKELWTAIASPEWVTALAFSPDGKILASADGFGESDIDLWDAATGKKIGQLEGHNSWVGSLVFWPDGKKLASASADQTIRVWDVASQKCLDVMRGHREEVWRLALLPDNKTLVSGSKDGAVCFWDESITHPREENITWPVKINAWNFAPDSRSVVTLDENGEVARWTGADFQEKEPLFEMGTNIIISVRRPYYYFSKDGRFLAIGSNTNGITSIWDVSRRVLWRQLTNAADDVRPDGFLANGNKLIVSSERPPSLHEWDLTTGLEIQSWPHPGLFQGTALSPDEQLCVAIGYEGDVITRNLADENTGTLPLDVLEASGTAFSLDGKFFAAASELGYARVWDAKTWKEVATLRGFLLGTHSVAFSPDATRLVTGNGAGVEALKLWDTDSWQDVITLQGSGSVFFEPAFSPDGNSVGALSAAGILHVWRAPSWAEINAAEKAQADNVSK